MTRLGRFRWLKSMSNVLAVRFRKKYEKGQDEHKGDLGEVPLSQLLDEMEAEALDQLAYINELRRRIKLK